MGQAEVRLWTDDEVAPFVTPWRAARLVRVVDGDTFDLDVDLGFDVFTRVRVRLVGEAIAEGLPAGVDAWETRGVEREAGLVAKARAIELLTGYWAEFLPIGEAHVRVYSVRGGSRGKYGRWLCAVLYRDGDGWRSVGDTLVAEGHAEAWP